ncbi:MAG: tetratricopeptide repeat protein [Spirochaetota bacterium]
MSKHAGLLLLAGLLLVWAGCSSAPKDQPQPRSTALEAAKFAEYGNTFFNEARYTEAAEMYSLAMNSYIRIDDQLGSSICYNALGKTFLAQGESEKAQRMFESAADTITIFSPLSSAAPKVKQAAAETYNNLGEFAYKTGKLNAALQWFEEGIALLEDEKELADALAILLHNRGSVYRARNELDAARQQFERALEINTKRDNRIELATNHYMLAVIALQRQNTDAAIRHAQTALEHDKLSENSIGIGHDLALLGRAQIAAGNRESGAEYLRRARSIFAALELDGDYQKVVEYLQRNNLE